jgi:hypothetical protein
MAIIGWSMQAGSSRGYDLAPDKANGPILIKFRAVFRAKVFCVIAPPPCLNLVGRGHILALTRSIFTDKPNPIQRFRCFFGLIWFSLYELGCFDD